MGGSMVGKLKVGWLMRLVLPLLRSVALVIELDLFDSQPLVYVSDP